MIRASLFALALAVSVAIMSFAPAQAQPGDLHERGRDCDRRGGVQTCQLVGDEEKDDREKVEQPLHCPII